MREFSLVECIKDMRGFSLVELMVVITIIGVLCSVGIPAYQDYVIRAKVANMYAMLQPTKIAVTENLISGSNTDIEKISNIDTIKEISVANNVITLLGDSEKLGLRPKDKVFKLTLTPDLDNPHMIVWKCKVDPADFKKYAPADCKP